MVSMTQYSCSLVSVCCDLAFYKVCVVWCENSVADSRYDSHFRLSVVETLFEVRVSEYK